MIQSPQFTQDVPTGFQVTSPPVTVGLVRVVALRRTVRLPTVRWSLLGHPTIITLGLGWVKQGGCARTPENKGGGSPGGSGETFGHGNLRLGEKVRTRTDLPESSKNCSDREEK